MISCLFAAKLFCRVRRKSCCIFPVWRQAASASKPHRCVLLLLALKERIAELENLGHVVTRPGIWDGMELSCCVPWDVDFDAFAFSEFAWRDKMVYV